jgi:LmbE family N-acetylglucosaminyl deacetylase
MASSSPPSPRHQRGLDPILGAPSVESIDFPDNRLDSIDRLDVIMHIEHRTNRHQPQVLYFYHAGDVNVDHHGLHYEVLTTCRHTRCNPVYRLLSFDVSSSTDWQTPGSTSAFQPNWFVDIFDQWLQKLKVPDSYVSEISPWVHARSPESAENLARFRSAQVSVKEAEVSSLLRQLR